MKKRLKFKAFTLIELLTVIAMVAVLLTLSTVLLKGSRVRARDSKKITAIQEIQGALTLYHNIHGDYPSQLIPGEPLRKGEAVYLERIPGLSSSAGVCSTKKEAEYAYLYFPENDIYVLKFCLEKPFENLSAGFNYLSPAGIYDFFPIFREFSGTIKYFNPTRDPISDATIYLNQNGVTKYSTEVAADGSFYFPEVPVGAYEVYFSLENELKNNNDFWNAYNASVGAQDAIELSDYIDTIEDPDYGFFNILPGLSVLAGDVYENSPEVIITQEDPENVLYLSGPYSTLLQEISPILKDKFMVFARAEEAQADYPGYPIQYSVAGTSPGYSTMILDIPLESNLEQDFLAVIYGDVDSFWDY